MARYWVGKKNLSQWRATWRVVLISSIPMLLVAVGYIFYNSREKAPREVAQEATSPASRPTSAAPSQEAPEAASAAASREVGEAASPPPSREAGEAASPASSAPAGESPDIVANRLQQAVDSLPLGQVIFHHPAQMQLRKEESVQIRISQDLKQDLAEGLSAQGVTEHDEIKTSASMKVRLTGDSNFDVKPLNDEEQLVTKSGYTEWSFTVLPLRRGNWPLHLVVTAVIRTPWGTEKSKDYPVKDELVQVRVSALNAASLFIGDNWHWLVTAVVFPLAIWLWRKRAGSREQRMAATRPAVIAVPLETASPAVTEPSQPQKKGEETEEKKSA